MKKKVVIIAVSLIGVLFIVYFYWNREVANQEIAIAHHIPKTNGVVGTINIGAIKEIIQSELFSRPMEMLSFHNKLGDQQFIGDLVLSIINGGVDEQQKMVFSMGKDSSDVSFLLMRTNNAEQLKTAFNEQLSQYQNIKIDVANSSFGNYYIQQKIGIVINEHFVLIASLDEQNVSQLWTEVVAQKECYEAGNTNISALIESPDHISVWVAKDGLKRHYLKGNNVLFFHVNFLKGKLELTTTIATANTYFQQHVANAYPCDTCALELSVNMDNTGSLPQLFGVELNQKIDSVFDILNIDYPQILDVCNGQLNCVVIGEGVQKETFVSYEFDDDFNKVKREKVVLTPVIDYMLSLGSDNKGLYNRLKQKGIIKQNNDAELFTNPVSKCYVGANNEHLQLVSNLAFLTKSANENTLNYGFIFRSDLDQLIPLLSPKDSSYSEVFKSIQCTGTQQDSLIEFKIEFTNKDASKNTLFDVANVCFR